MTVFLKYNSLLVSSMDPAWKFDRATVMALDPVWSDPDKDGIKVVADLTKVARQFFLLLFG